jgi:hypothetical protein
VTPETRPGVIVVNPGDSADVFTQPGGTLDSGDTSFTGGKQVQTSGQSNMDGTTWYQVGPNKWVKASDILFEGESRVPPAGLQIGWIQVDDAASVYASPNGAKTGLELLSGSAWRITRIANVNNRLWYQVGTNQWITDGVQFTQQQIRATGVVYQSVDVVNAPNGTQLVGRQHLTNNTAWVATARQILADGSVWYQVATGQWVSANNFLLNGQSEYFKADQLPVAFATENGGTSIFTAPGGQTLDHRLAFGSAWKVTGVAAFGNQLWYQVATNQWIKGSDSFAVEPKQITWLPQDTVGVVNYQPGKNTALWTMPGRGVVQGRTLANDTAWKTVFKVTLLDGSTWYEVGRNEWINGRYFLLNGSQAQSPDTTVVRIKNNVRATVYQAPGRQPIGRTLAPNTAWRVSAVVAQGNQLWYQVANGQWISGLTVN